MLKNIAKLGAELANKDLKQILGGGGNPPPPPGTCALGKPCDPNDPSKICCLDRGGNFHCEPLSVCMHL